MSSERSAPMALPAELQGKLTVDVPTAARVLGIGKNQAYAAVRAGELPCLRIGARLLVPVGKLLALLGEVPQ